MTKQAELTQDARLAVDNFDALLKDLNRQTVTDDGDLDTIIEGQATLITDLLAALPDGDRTEAVTKCRVNALSWDGIGDRACAMVGLPVPKQRSFLLEQSADDEGNAQCTHKLHGQGFAWNEAYGYLHYNGQHWQRRGAEAVLNDAVVETLKMRRRAAVEAEREAIVKTTRSTSKNVYGAKYLFNRLVYCPVDDFDANKDVINCNNGVVDLRTGQLVAHDPGQRFTYRLPVDYDPEADRTAWVNFLTEVVGYKVIVNYLQECIGYSLTGHTSEECLFYISGPPRSGKGTFTETLLTMFGRRPLASEVDFGTFTMRRDRGNQNFDLAPLKPCRFVAASENRSDRWLNAEMVKRVTGGNYIYCAFKRKDFFNYRPQYKIWLTSNFAVNADPDDDALWTRLRVVNFPTSFVGKEDKALKKRLLEPANLAGLLAWAVDGAVKWYERGAVGLVEPAMVTSETNAARDAIDFVGQWLTEHITKTDNNDHFIPNRALYGTYSSWCNGVGVTPKGQRKLTQSLKRKGYLAGEQRKVDGKNTKGCIGVQFVTGDLAL